MVGEELKILLIKDKAYLTKDVAMEFNQFDFPNFVKYFDLPAYLIIKVRRVKENQKEIYCDIKSYVSGETWLSKKQEMLTDKLALIERVWFKSINTMYLLDIHSGPCEDKVVSKPEKKIEPLVLQPKVEIINETFNVPLKKTQFNNGNVSFKLSFSDYHQPVKCLIENQDIIQEFDSVKNYFANVLKTKIIKVKAHIEITNYQVTFIKVESPEIKKINRKLIEDVKLEMVKKAVKKKSKENDGQIILSMTEYLDSYGEKELINNVLFNNESDLFENIMTVTNTKHYDNLRYLSDKHVSSIMKLRFVHKPLSFIFLLETKKQYHLIWETLNTEEATYVWHMEKNIDVLKSSLKVTEGIINEMNIKGKNNYISGSEDWFSRVYHDYSDQKKGFNKWKQELKNILI